MKLNREVRLIAATVAIPSPITALRAPPGTAGQPLLDGAVLPRPFLGRDRCKLCPSEPGIHPQNPAAAP